jgi:hypothetical protein
MSPEEQEKAVGYFLSQEEPPSVREFQRLLEGDGLDDTTPKKRKPRAPKSPVVKITGGFQRSLDKIKSELEGDPKFLDKAATEFVGALKPDDVDEAVGILEDLIKRIRQRNRNR